MYILILFSLAFGQALCSEDYDYVTRQIRLEMSELQDEAFEIQIEIEKLGENLTNSIPELKPVSVHSDAMYKWFSSSQNGQPRKCLAMQKNIEMIRNHSSESTTQCHSRIDRIVSALKNKAASLKDMVNKQVIACINLTSPCEIISKKNECLAQAWEQAKQRHQSIVAALQRFNIFKKLHENEAQINCQMCQAVSNSYQQAQTNEEAALDLCLKENDQSGFASPKPDLKQ